MKTLLRLSVIIGVFAGLSFGQTAALAPIGITFQDNNGLPLSGGFIYSYLGGTSTPVATFTDSTGSTPNSNPIVLNAAGQASIWLIPGTGYKFVIQNSSTITLRTIDGVVVALPSSGPWTLSSAGNITNNNPGRVGVGCTTPVSVLDICGSSSGSNYLLRIDDSASSPGVNFFGASSSLLGSIAADSSAAFRVRAANSASQLFVVQGGVTIEDQTPSSGTTTLNLIAGPGQGTNHFLSVKNNTLTELAFIDQLGEFAAPLFNATGNAMGITFQNNTSTFSVDTLGDISGSGSINMLGTGSDSPAAYQVNGVSVIDSSRNAIVNNLTVQGTCTGCGGGGGGGSSSGPINSIQISNGIGGFASSGSFTLASGTVTLAGTGSFQTTGTTSGFDATLCTAVNCIQAPNGGVSGLNLIATGSVFWTELGAQPAVSGSGQSAIYADSSITGTGKHMLQWSGNGGNYFPVAIFSSLGGLTNGDCASIAITGTVASIVDAGGACTTGGGGGTVASSSIGQVPVYTAATTVTGSSKLTFNNTTGVLTTSGGTTPGIVTVAISTTGPVQVTGSSSTLSVNTNTSFAAISAPDGGIGDILNGTFINYIQPGSFSNLASGPTLSASDTFHNGALSYYTGVTSGGPCLAIFVSSSWACFTGGGGGSISTIVGTTNEIVITNPTGPTVTIATPQPIGTGSAVSFGAVTTTSGGAFTSTAAGSSPAFTTNTGTFTALGNGNVGGQIANFNGYQLGGTNVITGGSSTPAGNFYSLTVGPGGCTGCGAGGGGVTSITGTVNEIIASASTGAVTLSTPQPIGLASNVSFNSLNAGCGGAGITQYVIQSCAPAGGSIAFQTSNNFFSVDGSGDISSNGGINATGASGHFPYAVNGVKVIDSSQNGFFANITATGSSCSGVLCLSGGTYTFQGNLTMGSGSNFYLRTFSGAASCGSIASGWLGIDTAGLNLDICVGGTLYTIPL